MNALQFFSRFRRSSAFSPNPERSVRFLVLLFVVLMTRVGTAQIVPELESLKSDYAVRISSTEGLSGTSITDLDKKYLARLVREQEQAQKAGKLDEALLIQEEVKIVTGGGSVPTEDDAKTPTALKTMHATYRAEIAKLTAAREKATKPLRDDYFKKLDALVISLTKEGRLQEAMTVKNFKESQVVVGAGASPAAGVGKSMTIKLPGGSTMMFCYCPPGEFKMGSQPDEPGRGLREDAANVRLTKGFWMAQTECTQKQWTAFMEANPSKSQGDNLPVEQVDWNLARQFITKLTEAKILPEGYSASLPTEAQWEYACRAGTKTAYSFGRSLRETQANFKGERAKNMTVVVGTYPPNAWGLYDMHGNVWEWCQDWMMDRLPGGDDPTGGSSGEFRIIRGGGWFNDVNACRSANRGLFHPGDKGTNVGLRVALNSGTGSSAK